jgi:hypothetical protein
MGHRGNIGRTTQGRDPITLADTQHASVNVRRARLKGHEGIGNTASRIIMGVKFDA